MLERENRREKILEAKSREMKLKVRTLNRQDEHTEDKPKLFQCRCEYFLRLFCVINCYLFPVCFSCL